MKLSLTVQPRFRPNFRPLVWVLLAFMGIAFVVAMVRYATGIGAISDLRSAYPWGFWISFDLFTGVAISSGGTLRHTRISRTFGCRRRVRQTRTVGSRYRASRGLGAYCISG
jgi:hypothetical protein